jgi:hypothetical protein
MSGSLQTERYSVLDKQKGDVWNSFLDTNSLGNLWQTIDYGKFASLSPYARTARIIATRNGVTEGIALGTFAKYLGFGTFVNVREGPVLGMASNDRLGVLKSINAALEKFGVENRVMGIEIEWPYKWGYADLFTSSGYKKVGKRIVYTIDLSKGIEDLWRHIWGNKRKNIKKAIDRGVEFIEASSFGDIEKFYRLLLEVAKRDKFVPGPLSWFQAVWNSRSQKDSSKVFFARWKGDNVSSVFATIHAKTIYALGFGYLSSALEVRPNDLLHWKIMEWGCKRGFMKYHMGEVHPESEDGAWRWKREWNGDQDPAYIFSKSISKHSFIEKLYGGLRKYESDNRVRKIVGQVACRF